MDTPSSQEVNEHTEQQLRDALHLTQFSVDHASVGIMRIGADARILSVNHHLCQLLGYTPDELYALQITDVDPNIPLDHWIDRHDLTPPEPRIVESSYRCKDGAFVPVEITTTYLEFQGDRFTIAFVHDISERKRVEARRGQLEQQLLQFQKMESIGRLASGIAHDFNNMITVIHGYCDLMDEAMSRGVLPLQEVEQIRLASQRAAALTRQLLTFSRKQMVSPSVIRLNTLVADMRTLLERMLGEDIVLRTTFEPELHPVIADENQFEQLIVNLAINARDAMPRGGILEIETSNIDIPPDYAASHPGAPSGPCVLLTITDTGLGMDELVKTQIFEPFFTTKEPGKGTGLGLAIVYGIVKQSGGDISVISQPNHGAIFQILLPASTTVANVPGASHSAPITIGGRETILLVEDDPLVRTLVQTVLRQQGYTILEATHGHDALAVAHSHPTPIDLLLTDVVMPHMNGRELAEQMLQVSPQIKVLFMSGYTDDAAVRHGLLTDGGELLAKPFSPLKLATRVREVLDKAHVTPPPQTYYDEARGALAQTLDIANTAANTRSFGQVMLAQGNVLAVMGNLDEASKHLERSLAIFRSLDDQSNQANLLERLGWVARERGDAAKALAFLEEAIAINLKLGDRQQLAWSLLTMSGVAILREDGVNAQALIEQGMALQPASHDWTGWRLNHQGHLAQLHHDYTSAAALHHQTLDLFVERLGDRSTGVLWAYQGLGETAIGRGDASAAKRWLRVDLQLSSELGTEIIMAWCLAGLGSAAVLDEHPVRAVRLWGAAAQLRLALGCRPAPATRSTYERLIALARAQLGEAAFSMAWAEGAALTRPQMLAEALDEG